MCFKYPFDIFKCGKCPECLQEERRDWSVRLQLHCIFEDDKPFFCHLTYNNKYVPKTDEGVLTLRKKDLQGFFKRLRYYLNLYYEKNHILDKKRLRYYCAGEYGPNGTHRPHYHCLLFGMPEGISELEAKTIIRKAWQFGDVRERSCFLKSMAQLHYVTKYMVNYFNEDFSKKTAPFRLVSAGLGDSFIRYALDNDVYSRDIIRKFKCDCYVSKLNNHRKPVFWYYEKPILHDAEGFPYVNPILQNFRDFVEIQQVVKGIPKTYRFPLPRYFQERLYTEDFRMALAEVKKYKMLHKNNLYHSENLEYDSTCPVPMWLQLKRYIWEKKKKTKKDKNLHININNVLND